MVKCSVFQDYEDRLFQQISIEGMVLRAILKLLNNSRYTDKYIHKKCTEFAEAGIEAGGKIQALLTEIRGGQMCTQGRSDE